MSNLHRYISALALCIIYGLVVLSPLAAQMAMRSPVIAHALTGECAGECGLCGCAPERSASRTCCCWQKKLQQEHSDHDDEQEQSDCCTGNQASPKHKSAGISSRPCNSGKTMALLGAGQADVLPFRFSQENLIELESVLIVNTPVRRADWPGEPPDPPPKLSCMS